MDMNLSFAVLRTSFFNRAAWSQLFRWSRISWKWRVSSALLHIWSKMLI